MANEKNDIGDIVKKCKILLLDIEGTTTSISFVKDKLFPYAEENVKDFLTNDWDTDDVKEVVTALRKLALEDEEKKVDGVVTIPAEDASKEDQIEGLVKSVKWQMSLDRKVAPLKQLQGLIWKKGYDKGDIKGHVYDDVSPALELWRSVEGQKVYIYSSGSVQAQKLLFGLSSSGDMLKLIDGHFDTAVGAKQEAASYTAIAEKIGCKAEEILFLTDIDKEAEAARASGVQAALVSREGNAPLASDIAASYPILYSFADLTTKKRKPDPQDEQPAKVLKTDIEADVKTTIETEVKESPNSVTDPPKDLPEEPEKMEVEEEAPTKEKSPAEKPTEEIVEKVGTIVEEITDSNEAADLPVCDTKPIIEESTEKTEKKETEMMEAESTEIVNSVPEHKENGALKNGDKDAPVPEETPPVVITEIKDITNDKENLNEVAEIIEDLVPVVEEPPAQDMEELQNVGDVLEKECDEILSKVQDVTNLDNIPLKPLLNTISEENMDTDNMDTNDIVENILDSEQELEMKQKADAELNTPKEEPAKQASEESKCEKQEVINNGTVTNVTEEKPIEKVAEEEKGANEVKVSEEKMEESSPTEEKVKGSSSTEEKIKEKRPVEEKVKESSPAAEKVKESSPAEEKVKESSPAEDKVKETSLTEKKVKESSPVEQKVEEASLPDPKAEENKVAAEETTKSEKVVENKMETDSTPATVDSTEKAEKIKSVNKPEAEEVKVDAKKSESDSKETTSEAAVEKSADKPAEESSMETDQTETPVATNDSNKVANDSPAEEVKTANEVKETQVNGKTTNGDTEMVNLNGDSNKEDELSSRLSIENGNKVVNGANGDSKDAEAKSENNGEEIKEVADIKVKTVAMDEPRNDPIEQPTEA